MRTQEPQNEFDQNELQVLYTIARMLVKEKDYGEMLAAALDVTMQAVGAERGLVVVREQGRFKAVVSRNFSSSDRVAQTEQEISTSIANAALEQGESLLVGDAQVSARFHKTPSVHRFWLRSVLCAPLLNSQRAFALLYLENRSVVNHFTERHCRLLEEICSLASPLLETAIAISEARRRISTPDSLLGAEDGIITADAEMISTLRVAREIAPTDLPVLIEGETGTGKELIAKSIYRHSSRVSGAFVVLNCSAIPETLIESELFGSVRGAFTGATHDRIGIIGAANHGTLFLDEIGEMPLASQPRLLRALQSGEFTRVGSFRREFSDVRVIAASNRDLEAEVNAGRFRSDLFYRLSAVTLRLPPLRQRSHDIPLLVSHFLWEHQGRNCREIPRFAPETLSLLAQYAFPGNVRELENEIARLLAIVPPGSVIGPELVCARMRTPTASSNGHAKEVVPTSLAEMEKRLIVSVLGHTEGNRSKAAEILGITREGLRIKMQRLGIKPAA